MAREKQFDEAVVVGRAMQVFWRHGYEATSVEQLVEATGINRGSLYATFGDKHALFVAALSMYDDRNRRHRLAVLESTYPPREAIRQLFLAFTTQLCVPGGQRGCLLTNTALERATRDRKAARVVRDAQRDIEAFLERMIRRGKRDGAIAAEVRPSEASKGLLASLLGVTVLMRGRPEPALLKAVVDDADRRLG